MKRRDDWKTPGEVLGDASRAKEGSSLAAALRHAERMRQLKAEGKPWLPSFMQADEDRRQRDLAWARNHLDGAAVDIPQRLRRAGCNEKHLARIQARREHPLEARPTLAAAKAWAAVQGAGRPFLLMLGTSGTGKTLAATVAMAMWAQSYPWNAQAGGGVQVEPMLMVRASSLTRLGGYDEESRRQELELQRCPLLALDDLGADNFTGSAASALHGVIDARWGASRLTIITSNLRLKGLSQRLDGETPGRFSRRLTENALILEENEMLSTDAVRALLSRQGALQ